MKQKASLFYSDKLVFTMRKSGENREKGENKLERHLRMPLSGKVNLPWLSKTDFLNQQMWGINMFVLCEQKFLLGTRETLPPGRANHSLFLWKVQWRVQITQDGLLFCREWRVGKHGNSKSVLTTLHDDKTPCTWQSEEARRDLAVRQTDRQTISTCCYNFLLMNLSLQKAWLYFAFELYDYPCILTINSSLEHKQILVAFCKIQLK